MDMPGRSRSSVSSAGAFDTFAHLDHTDDHLDHTDDHLDVNPATLEAMFASAL